MKKMLFWVLFILLVGCVSAASNNITNETIRTSVTVADSMPVIVTATMEDDDGGLLDLVPNASTLIRCHGLAYDVDGWSGLTVNTTMFLTSAGSAAADSYVNHYTNHSGPGNCTETQINATYIKYNCSNMVWFHASAGSWTCNVTLQDSSGNQENLSTTATMGELLALNVDNATLDFGTLAVGASTDATDYNISVFNHGNVVLDLMLRSYAWAVNDNHTMNCTASGIAEGFLRYNLTGQVDWTIKHSINNTPFTDTTFSLSASTASTGTADLVERSANRTTCWGFKVPDTSENIYSNGTVNTNPVSGTCSGYLEFAAVVDS